MFCCLWQQLILSQHALWNAALNSNVSCFSFRRHGFQRTTFNHYSFITVIYVICESSCIWSWLSKWWKLISFHVNVSLNWQHQLCKNPRPNPDIKTLFVDHSCGQPNGARAPSPANNPLLGSLPKAGGFPPLGAHGVSYFLLFIHCSWFKVI